MKKILFLLMLTCYITTFAGSGNHYCTGEPVFIKAGQPTVLVVSVFAKDEKDADDFFAKREMEELQDNFPEFDIILIDKNVSVIFENNTKDILNLTNPKETMEIAVFWDGKKASTIKVSKTKTKVSEFVSGLTGLDKKSSYLAENAQTMADCEKLKGVFNPDKNAKAFGQYYIIDRYFNKMVYGAAEFFKPQNYKGINSVTVYSKMGDNPEELAFKMNFNAKNQVTDILYAKRAGSSGTVFIVFSYDGNGLLKKMISNENFDNEVKSSVAEFSYDNEKMIEYSEECMWILYMQKGILAHSYIEYKDVEKDFRIKKSSEVVEDNCFVTYDEDQITMTYCPSNFESTVPYTYENTLYEDGAPSRKATSKIDKTGKNTYAVYGYASAIKEYKQMGEVVMNEKGLTEKVTTKSRQQDYTLRFEYNLRM